MENLGKQIVDISTGKIVGWILDVALDEKLQKVGYYAVDEESEDELFLPSEEILANEKDFVTVNGTLGMQFVLERKVQLFGKIVISDKGENFGVVQKLQFVGRKCNKICTEKCEIATKYIKMIGLDVVVVAFGRKNIFGNPQNSFGNKKIAPGNQRNVPVGHKIALGDRRNAYGGQKSSSGGRGITSVDQKKEPYNTGFPRTKTDAKVSIQNFFNPNKTSNLNFAHYENDVQMHNGMQMQNGLQMQNWGPIFGNDIWKTPFAAGANAPIFGGAPGVAYGSAAWSGSGENFAETDNLKTMDTPAELPEKVRLSSNYYVGKTCTEDIVGYNNEKIASKGQVITKNVVEKAKKHNKLNQLFFAIQRK